ncbi:hypothetical protein ALC57_09816 [Trachymyrmex cornetzi]|uniref:Uncharacterized protein n=1 Tax=Trachymyrmex cornetzi TaxID=471704 RepID=A0A195DZ78_9HYME|nr:hypothetical protein ALC57_09816 [Trachymyrmex cornetzi]
MEVDGAIEMFAKPEDLHGVKYLSYTLVTAPAVVKRAKRGIGCGAVAGCRRKVAYLSLPRAESTPAEDYFWTFYRASASSVK